MSARYRLIQYVPDPFTDSRVTIGALVQVGGEVALERAEHIPGPNCLGTRQAWVNAHAVLDALAVTRVFDAPSAEVSALALIGEPQRVPAAVSDALKWVRTTVLPRKGEASWPCLGDKEVVNLKNKLDTANATIANLRARIADLEAPRLRLPGSLTFSNSTLEVQLLERRVARLEECFRKADPDETGWEGIP